MIRNGRIAVIPVLILMAGCSGQNDLPEQVKDSPVIHARFAGQGSRTVLKDETTGDLEWTSGDAIKLFIDNNAGLKYVTADGGPTAKFSKAADESGEAVEGTTYFGLYPYDETATYDGKVLFTSVPSVQTALAGSYDPKAFLATGKSETTDLGFYNVCGGIRFTLEDPDITSVVLRGAGNEALAGNISIETDGDNIPTAISTEPAVKEIKLVSNVAMGNSENTFYYITMIPQTLQEGFVMEFYKGDELYLTSTCNKPVTISRGVFSTIRRADDPDTFGAPLDGEDLSTNGKANCYIISKAGTYKFPTVIGNGTESISAAYAKVLWETDNTETAIGRRKIIERCSFNNGYIQFKTADQLRNGNALIAAFNEFDQIVWSWHIWVCEGYDPALSAQNCGTAKMMDRNLGALSSTAGDPLSTGLFYQWGRKDPFMGTANPALGAMMESTGQMSYARNDKAVGSENFCIANPTAFYLMVEGCTNDWYYGGVRNDSWSAAVKTINDPCPAGWRIPEADVWSAGTGNAWYPSCGYVNCSNGAITGAGEYSSCWTVSSENGNASVFELINGSGKIATDARPAEGRSVRCIKE